MLLDGAAIFKETTACRLQIKLTSWQVDRPYTVATLGLYYICVQDSLYIMLDTWIVYPCEKDYLSHGDSTRWSRIKGCAPMYSIFVAVYMTLAVLIKCLEEFELLGSLNTRKWVQQYIGAQPLMSNHVIKEPLFVSYILLVEWTEKNRLRKLAEKD